MAAPRPVLGTVYPAGCWWRIGDGWVSVAIAKSSLGELIVEIWFWRVKKSCGDSSSRVGHRGSVGARGTHEVLAPVPVRGVDRRGVRESAAAMGCWSVGQAGRVDRVTASASREAGSGGSDWRVSSGAPERRAVHGLAEVGDGHVVGLSEGRGCLDLKVRGLNRERGQRARAGALGDARDDERAREERHVRRHSSRREIAGSPP